jgi:hypothetical protein
MKLSKRQSKILGNTARVGKGIRGLSSNGTGLLGNAGRRAGHGLLPATVPAERVRSLIGDGGVTLAICCA